MSARDTANAPSQEALGDLLFADVAEFEERSPHRTGTTDDEERIDWLPSVPRGDGASTTTAAWEIPAWKAEWIAELDGQIIYSLSRF